MIIEQLFMDEPTDTTVHHTATFMYGNGVPIRLAIDCFNECNGMRQWYVEEKFREWYYIRTIETPTSVIRKNIIQCR
jgi:hypothetical protein